MQHVSSNARFLVRLSRKTPRNIRNFCHTGKVLEQAGSNLGGQQYQHGMPPPPPSPGNNTGWRRHFNFSNPGFFKIAFAVATGVALGNMVTGAGGKSKHCHCHKCEEENENCKKEFVRFCLHLKKYPITKEEQVKEREIEELLDGEKELK